MTRAPDAAAAESQSPWPARVVAAITIISILAILLAIFLPRERQEVTPQSGPTIAQNPGPAAQASGSQHQAVPSQQWRTHQPRQQQPTPQPQPRYQQPTPTQPRRPDNPVGQSSRPDTPVGPQPTAEPMPQSAAMPQGRPLPEPAPAAAQSDMPQRRAGPESAPRTPDAPVGPGATPRPTQRVTPEPAPQRAPRPNPLFTQDEASGVVARVEALQRQAAGAPGSPGEMALIVGELRKPQYQKPETWAFVKTTLPMMLAGLQAPGNEQLSQEGMQDIGRIIAPSRTGAEAAAMLERVGARGNLPPALKRDLLRTLAAGFTPGQVFGDVDGVLRRHRYSLSPEASNYLRRQIDQAGRTQR